MLPASVPVEEFTTPDPITVSDDISIKELHVLMTEHGIRHLPVMRDGEVVGVISDRDVRLFIGMEGSAELNLTAADIMTEDPLCVDSSMPLDEVAFIMSENKVGSVLVLEDDALLGIFTVTDAMNALIEIVRDLQALRNK